MATQTIYVQVVGEGESFDPDKWTPWKNCTDAQQTCMMAIRKRLRESGYFSAHPDTSRPTLQFDVYHFAHSAPRHKNGRPMTVHCLKVRCAPD